MGDDTREYMERPTKRARPTPVGAKLKKLLTEGINTQDGLLGDALDALRAVLPYATNECAKCGVREAADTRCIYCKEPTCSELKVCLQCAIGMAKDVLNAVPDVKRMDDETV